MPEENKQINVDVNSFLYKLRNAVVNFIVPIIAFGVALLLIVLYIYPSFKSLTEKREELNNKISLKNTLSEKVSDLKVLSDFGDVLNENLEIVNKVLVPEADVPRLLDQATQISQRAGMELDRLSYSYGSKAEEEKETDFDVVNVSMGVNSSFEQLVLFMELVEKAARYVSVSNFRYSVSEDREEGVSRISSSFSLDSPYLFVESSAVTDEPIGIDIKSSDFVNFMDMLKGLDYYDFVNRNIQAEEEKPEEEEQTEEETAVENTEEQTTETGVEIMEEPITTPVVEEDTNTESLEQQSVFPTD
jgi:Tfp pilus assembly protein PilO